jgi:hypothetical protein
MSAQPPRTFPRVAAFGKHLCRAALALFAVEVAAIVIDAWFLSAEADGGEMLMNVALLAGLLAPLVAILALILIKLARAPVSRWVVASLVAGVFAASLPVMFFLAYGNCPNGVC